MFYRRVLRVVGVDENGYGPLVGPLVVTRVLLRYEGEDPTEELQLAAFPHLPIQDSKRLFLRSLSSYARGEGIALALLRHTGLVLRSTWDLFDHVILPSDTPLKGTPYGEELSLPLWAKDLPRFNLDAAGVVIEEIRSRVFLPENLRGQNKLLINLRAFLDHANASRADVALLGKIGGMRYYHPHLPEGVDVIRESSRISHYRLQQQEILFIRKADAQFLPVAMASVVGKYIREILMLSLNRALGYREAIPWASGYHHDPRSHQLVKEALRRGWDITRP